MDLIDIIILGIWVCVIGWHLEGIKTRLDTTNKILIEIQKQGTK